MKLTDEQFSALPDKTLLQYNETTYLLKLADRLVVLTLGETIDPTAASHNTFIRVLLPPDPTTLGTMSSRRWREFCKSGNPSEAK